MGLFGNGLARTRQSLFGRLAQLVGNTEIDGDTWDDIESVLVQSDVGVATTKKVIEDMRARIRREGITQASEVLRVLRESLRSFLDSPPPPNITGRPLSVVLIVGVNGSGKTTSIAKLAFRYSSAGRNVMLAAGDTFRAAAIDQLKMWGERVEVPVIATQPGADPAAVTFDAINAAKARECDLLIIDTAGRLHTNFNLMEELAKVRNVIRKSIPDAPHEVWLVLDGTTGQNALQQAQKFQEMVDVSGVIVTKLDGSAKGGMIFSIVNELKLPVQFVGLGEGLRNMVPFDPDLYVASLFEETES